MAPSASLCTWRKSTTPRLETCAARRYEGGEIMKILFRVLVLFFGITGVGTDVSFAQSGWFWQNPLPQGNTLNAVAVLDPQNAIAGGNSGFILRSSDGGATWAGEPSGA